LIKTKIESIEILIDSEYSRAKNIIKKDLLDLGFDTNFRVRLFDILYKGCGACLILIEDGKVRAIPFFHKEEIVKVKYSSYDDKILSIHLKNEDPNDPFFYALDLNTTNYYLLYNARVGDTYKSNLTVAAPYIVLDNHFLQRDLDFAKSGFTDKPIITPDIEKILSTNGDINATIGGIEYNLSHYLQKNVWGTISKQITEQVKRDPVPVLPFGVKIQNLSQDNTKNQTAKIREYLDDMITRACHASGSVLGRTGSNRAESEQQRDNFEEQSIKTFQNMVCKVANEFLIPLLAPENADRFFCRYYSAETDESIKLRDQQLELAKLIITPEFQSFQLANNYKLDADEVASLFNTTHGLKLLGNETVEAESQEVENTESESANLFTRAVNKPKSINFSDIESNPAFENTILAPLTNALTLQMKAVRRANNLRVELGDEEFNKFMPIAKFKDLLRKFADLTISEYKNSINPDAVNLKSIDTMIDELTQLHYVGGEVTSVDKEGNPTKSEYLGFNNSQRNQLKNIDTSQFNDTRIKQYIKTQVQSITNNLYLPFFSETYQVLAIEDGAEYIGTDAKNDQLVRDHHLRNSGWAWRIGSNPPDSRNPNFYLEPFCRCSRTYGTKEQLKA
ncbi:MAG: hypothetical protein ACRCXZ_02545, partial [Patescibacteria group bacterium]